VGAAKPGPLQRTEGYFGANVAEDGALAFPHASTTIRLAVGALVQAGPDGVPQSNVNVIWLAPQGAPDAQAVGETVG
jgi:hypothetical protein